MAGSLRKPLMRIPYTGVFAAPRIYPVTANTTPGAVQALLEFIAAPPTNGTSGSTACLTGAGLSVASGLADYRGDKGTYRVNKSYKPIYYHEFIASHAARRRYWARSFLGWSSLRKAKPNAAHRAIADLANLAVVSSVVTQNVDGLHHAAAAAGEVAAANIVELHGYLRSLVCVTCRSEYPRSAFQEDLARLNPAWALFLQEALASGALGTEDPAERRLKGIRANPDGDVDLPNAPYTTFRYPACPRCLHDPPRLSSGDKARVEVDADGAWTEPGNAGILKPAVVMFGESIASEIKAAAEEAITRAGKLMILGTSLATYSAWRLARLAKDQGKPMAIVNMGGVRGEDAFFVDIDPQQTGAQAVRSEMPTEVVLPTLVEALGRSVKSTTNRAHAATPGHRDPAVFKDMLS